MGERGGGRERGEEDEGECEWWEREEGVGRGEKRMRVRVSDGRERRG